MTSTADTQAPNPRDCEHGQLRRSCELCELLAELDRLQATITRRGELLLRLMYLLRTSGWDGRTGLHEDEAAYLAELADGEDRV